MSALRRGAVRAQNMARRVGMHPFDEDVQIDDERGGGGGGGGGDGRVGVVVMVALVAMKVVKVVVVMVVVVVVVAVVALVTLAVENLVMIKMVRKFVAKRLFLQTSFITHLKV